MKIEVVQEDGVRDAHIAAGGLGEAIKLDLNGKVDIPKEFFVTLHSEIFDRVVTLTK